MVRPCGDGRRRPALYVRAMAAKQTKEPDKVIDAAMIQAVQIAAKITPYRHARLSAAKLPCIDRR